MFKAIYTEILGVIIDYDVGLLITFASQQHKRIPERINIVHHDLHEVLIVLTLSLWQYTPKYWVRSLTVMWVY